MWGHADTQAHDPRRGPIQNHPHAAAPPAPGMLGRAGAREEVPKAVRQAVGGGCQSGWRRLLAVTNAIEVGTCCQGDSGWAWGGGGSLPSNASLPAPPSTHHRRYVTHPPCRCIVYRGRSRVHGYVTCTPPNTPSAVPGTRGLCPDCRLRTENAAANCSEVNDLWLCP